MGWAKWVVLVGWVLGYQAQACLRPNLDERAVQWSAGVVRATLLSQKDPAGADQGLAMVASRWKVVETFDGPFKPDTEVTVLTFPSPDAPACHELPAPGKTFVLLLRPAKECEFTVRKDATAVDGYVIVARLTEDGATEDAVSNLKDQIAAVRKAEATVSEKDAQLKAETLANALDDTEAEHAEAALIYLGPKALPAVKQQFAKATPTGRSRLQRVIDELSPPPADTGKRAEPAKD